MANVVTACRHPRVRGVHCTSCGLVVAEAVDKGWWELELFGLDVLRCSCNNGRRLCPTCSGSGWALCETRYVGDHWQEACPQCSQKGWVWCDRCRDQGMTLIGREDD